LTDESLPFAFDHSQERPRQHQPIQTVLSPKIESTNCMVPCEEPYATRETDSAAHKSESESGEQRKILTVLSPKSLTNTLQMQATGKANYLENTFAADLSAPMSWEQSRSS
jgi:hypothetical protein